MMWVRDRDRIALHLFANEQQWAAGLGVFSPEDAYLTSEKLQAHREA